MTHHEARKPTQKFNSLFTQLFFSFFFLKDTRTSLRSHLINPNPLLRSKYGVHSILVLDYLSTYPSVTTFMVAGVLNERNRTLSPTRDLTALIAFIDLQTCGDSDLNRSRRIMDALLTQEWRVGRLTKQSGKDSHGREMR